MLSALTTYEIISIVLAIVTILFAATSVVIAIWSSRQATKEVNRLINDTNRATRANIAVEIDKLEVEKFRLSMQISDLKTQKERLQQDPYKELRRIGGNDLNEQLKIVDSQLDRCHKLHTEMGMMQIEMQKTLDNFK